MDAGDRAVLVGPGEGRLDLARHELRRGVADEVAHVRADIWGRVEDLVLADAGPGVAGDVADGVAAALARGQAARGEDAQHVGRVLERDVVHLDVLPRRDVALVERHVLLDRVGERLHLLGRDPAERELHTDHLHAGLALAVDALLEPEADELVLGRLTVEELRRLGLEVLELALEDRDDVTGDVLADLRVLEGPRPAGGPLALEGGWFHDGRLQKCWSSVRTQQYTQSPIAFIGFGSGAGREAPKRQPAASEDRRRSSSWRSTAFVLSSIARP